MLRDLPEPHDSFAARLAAALSGPLRKPSAGAPGMPTAHSVQAAYLLALIALLTVLVGAVLLVLPGAVTWLDLAIYATAVAGVVGRAIVMVTVRAGR
jgi:hypothetical protein